jgi:hypothetical protein
MCILDAVSAKMKPTSASTDTMQIDLLASDIAESNLALQQFVEMASNEPKSLLNPMVKIASRLGLERVNAASFAVDGQHFFHAQFGKEKLQ